MTAASDAVDDTDEEEALRPSLALRLKRLLIAPLILLKRLRRPAAESGEEAPPPAQEDEEEAPASPAPGRRLLPFAAVLLAGAAAGSGMTYWLSAQIVARQARTLSGHEQEIVRLKNLLAGYDKMMLEHKKKLDEEKGRRAELENRLALARADLTRRPPSHGSNARPAAGDGTAGHDRAGSCTLRPGTIGSTLKGCLEEFNR